MPILPRVIKGCLVLPIPTVVLTYGTYLSVALLVLGMRYKIMTEITMIPDASLLPVILTIILVALFSYVTIYLMAYVERKSDINALKKEAVETGAQVDPLEIERVKNFHSIYIAAMLLGAVASVVISFASIVTVIPTYLGTPGGTLDYVVTALFATAVISFLVDRFFCHPLADGTFKKKVVDPALNKVVDAFQNPPVQQKKD